MAITKVTNSLVATNAIQGTLIADNAITSVHIAQNQVTSVQIPDSSITSTQLAANSVDTAELISGSIDAIHLASDSVTTAKILDANITTAKIANNAITSALIPDGSITDTQLGSGAFTMGNITTTGSIRGPASLTIDPATVGDNTGTVVIAGNLQVDGTTTTVNSTTVDIVDKNITLGKGGSASANNGGGITIDGAAATMLYTHATTSFDFNKPVNITGNLEVEDGGNVRQIRLKRAGSTRVELSTNANEGELSLFRSSNAKNVYISSYYDSYFNGGNVGIGNTNPNKPLTITADSGANGMALRARSADDYSFFQFFNNAGTALRGQIYSKAAGDIGFTTGTDSSAGNDLYIKNGTGVGIGTASPNFMLHINKGTSSYAPTSGVNENVFGINTSYNATGTQGVTLSRLDGNWIDGTSGADSAYGWLWSYENNVRGGLVYDHRGSERMHLFSSYGALGFITPNAADGNGVPTDSNMVERLTILPGGNVRINNTSPDHRLHIQGDTNDLSRVRVTNTASGQASLDLDN